MDTRPAAAPSLKDTIRTLRIAEAERTDVVVALREADVARLGILHDRLKPVFAEVPDHVDLFDVGVLPGEPPRLWIDMITFVEIARDKRSYRLVQDRRHGRQVLLETPDVHAMAERITVYVARRLIERERLIAQPSASQAEDPAPSLPSANVPPLFAAAARQVTQPMAVSGPAEGGTPAPPREAAHAEPPSAEAQRVRFSGFGAIVIFLLGIAVGIGGVLAVAQIAVRL